MIKFLAGAVLAATLAGTAGAQAASGRLLVYTSQLEPDAQQTVEAFERLHPEVDVEWTRSGTTEIMNRLRAEIAAGSPQPDVLLIADAVTMEGLKAEDRLLRYEDAPVAGYRPGTHDPEGYYFGTKLITTGIMVNASAPMRPTSWADLAAPEAENLVVMPSPLYSGAAAIHMATLTGVPGLGPDYYARLKANGATAVKGNGAVMSAVAGGEKLYGVVVDYLPIRENLKGAPVEFVFPSEGVSAVTEPAAILSTAGNPEAAKAFVDFLLSREGQELAARQGFLPAHPDVAPPEGFPEPASITVLPLDGARALKRAEADKRAFADLFGG